MTIGTIDTGGVSVPINLAEENATAREVLSSIRMTGVRHQT
jgi:hypothetical protein